MHMGNANCTQWVMKIKEHLKEYKLYIEIVFQFEGNILILSMVSIVRYELYTIRKHITNIIICEEV